MASHRSTLLLKPLTFFIVMILVVVTTSQNGGAAGDEAQVCFAPVNPAYSGYTRSMAGEFTLAPEPVDLSYLKGLKLATVSVFPTKYDLRDQGKVTPIRDQIPAGTCWAFAGYASMESCLLPESVYDFSENHMKNMAGFDLDPNTGGGDRLMLSAYLTRGDGPVSEEDDPYDPYTTISGNGIVQKHIGDILFLPDRNDSLDNDNIKWAVMEYGAVYTTVFWDSRNYSGTTHSYYMNPAPHIGNHAMAIIGWDDAYSRNNFTIKPPGNGAFICKNSWGTAYGDNGYVYVSYYDSRIGIENAVILSSPCLSYDNAYGYDRFGWTNILGYGHYGYGDDTAWMAAEYVASSSERLTAIGLYTPSENVRYDVSVNLSGTMIPAASGTMIAPGYHTIKLDRLIDLNAGQRFRVEVKLTTPGFNYPVCIETRLLGYSSRAIANRSECFISHDGVSWQDMEDASHNASVCLKAFTVDLPSTETLITCDPAGKNVTVIDAEDGRLDRIRSGITPYDCVASAGGYVYVTDLSAGTVTVIDRLSMSPVKTLNIGGMPTGTVLSADNRYLLVCDRSRGKLVIIDLFENMSIRRVSAGIAPEDCTITPDGKKAYVTDSAGNSIKVIDMVTGSLIKDIPAGGMQRDIALSPDGRMACAAVNADGGIALLIDTISDTVIHKVPLSGVPHDAVFSPDGTRSYLSCHDGDRIAIIDTTNGTNTGNITIDNPHGLAISADGRTLYVTRPENGVISLVEISYPLSVHDIPAGILPHEVCLAPSQAFASISFLSGDLSVNRSEATIALTVSREGCLDRRVSAGYSFSGGCTAYGRVEFCPGDVSETIRINIGASNMTGRLHNTSDGAVVSGFPFVYVAVADDGGPSAWRLSLTKGWNLISLPLEQENASMASLFTSSLKDDVTIVWAYDTSNRSSPEWKYFIPALGQGSLESMNSISGYWFYAARNTSFSITGSMPGNENHGLGPGWTLIGYSGDTGDPSTVISGYEIIWGYKNGTWAYNIPEQQGSTLKELKRGEGYWVYV